MVVLRVQSKNVDGACDHRQSSEPEGMSREKVKQVEEKNRKEQTYRSFPACKSCYQRIRQHNQTAHIPETGNKEASICYHMTLIGGVLKETKKKKKKVKERQKK
jgi:hypothetical protein